MKIFFAHPDTERFIQSLEKSTIAKVLRVLELLETFENRLGMPHSKSVSSKLLELRVRGQQEVRLLYTFHNHTVVILHGFIKTSAKLAQRDLQLALRRLRQLARL